MQETGGFSTFCQLTVAAEICFVPGNVLEVTKAGKEQT